MAADEETRAGSVGTDEVLHCLSRHFNLLNEPAASVRKRALEAIRAETVDNKLSSHVLQPVLARLLKPLLTCCLEDQVERCRETAIRTLTELVRCSPAPEDSLPYVMPGLAQRLGAKDIREPSEELRLALVELLGLLVEVCGGRLAPYLDDVVTVLTRTITDPFPDVKIESCKCTVHFARCVPDYFHMQGESLVKPLIQTISHQRSRVRVAATQATGAVVRYGGGKNVDAVLSYLTQRLFDDSPQVRTAVAVVVGDWLLNLDDRYSYFHKLIPLLLSGLNDDMEEIKTLSWNLWCQVGSQWEKENEEDLKDKLDFLLSPPAWYPPEAERPSLGCRELVVRNLSKLVPAVQRDAGDWQAETRVKTLQLLRVLLLHAEDHCTQHLQPLLHILHHACAEQQDEPRATTHALESARLLGFFVNVEVLLKLMLPHVESSCSSSVLMVLGAVLSGCSRPALRPHLPHIASTLVQPDVCQLSSTVVYQEQVVCCVQVLLNVCEDDCSVISLQLLQLLLTVQSLSTEPELLHKVGECVRSVCVCVGVGAGDVCELYRRHMVELLDWLCVSQRCWTSHMLEHKLLDIILLQSGPVLGEFLAELLPLLKACLEPSRDPELRLHVLTTLSKLLLNAQNTLDSQGRFVDQLCVFLQDLILPNLVWCAGRTAAAVRTAALSCLLALLHGGAVTSQQVLSWEPELSTRLISALEESSALARVLACRTLLSFIKITTAQLEPDTLLKIYPELLKRVDDSKDEVRIEALKALSVWFSSLGQARDVHSYRPHLEFLFKQLLLYLDDPEPNIRPVVLDVLKAGGLVDSVVLQQELEAVRVKQRSSEYYNELLTFLQTL